MKVVWKFALGMGLNVITVPVGAKIVHIEMQDGFPQLWAEISDPSSSHVEVRQFEIFGTGHPIPDKAQHVGTFLDPPYVWHVYELVNP